MKVCRWCKADEPTVDFLGRICDENPTGIDHEMVAQCFECEEPVSAGFRLCTSHYVASKS